ncbi:ParA family protein [Candidatus Poribacteria bacterium]|nr:ParA family protein [Candidatus Poribacteria bacterium]
MEAPPALAADQPVSQAPPSGEPVSAVSHETVDAPCQVIAVINQKGGVGKTTTAVNLAADLAARGHRTLVIDLDPQGNASTALGVDRFAEGISTAYDLLFPADGATQALVLGPKRPDVIPGNVSLVRADLDLLALGEQRHSLLRKAIEPLLPRYDYILIDTPPSLGMLTLNILIASHSALIPVQCEYLALEGLTMLLETIEEIRQSHNPGLAILGCLVTMTDLRTNLAQQVVADIREHLGDLVFDSMVPRTVRLSECPSHGKTIFEYDRWGAGSRAYESLTTEVLSRTQGKKPPQTESNAGGTR